MTVALCALIKYRYCESTSPAWLGQTFPSLTGFVSATRGSEMKIGYKTRKGMFFPRPPKIYVIFSTLDILPSILDKNLHSNRTRLVVEGSQNHFLLHFTSKAP